MKEGGMDGYFERGFLPEKARRREVSDNPPAKKEGEDSSQNIKEGRERSI